MVKLHTRWLRDAGVSVKENVPVEISPLWALDADQVKGHARVPTEINEPTFLC
jgi:hypothetical protein